MKCSWAQLNGQPVLVSKDPLELNANGEPVKSFKKSKGGRLQLVQDGTDFRTVSSESSEPEGLLRTVFENGELLVEDDFETIRQRLWPS